MSMTSNLKHPINNVYVINIYRYIQIYILSNIQIYIIDMCTCTLVFRSVSFVKNQNAAARLACTWKGVVSMYETVDRGQASGDRRQGDSRWPIGDTNRGYQKGIPIGNTKKEYQNI